MSNPLLRTLISEMIESYLFEGANYDHHAAVVKLPDGNRAIIGTSKDSFEKALIKAKGRGLVDLHKGKPIEHFKITKRGHGVVRDVGFDHDEKKSYDHKRWKFDAENKTATHDSEKYEGR